MEDPMKALQTIERAVAKSTENFSELRRRADTIYQDRVDQIRRIERCTASAAHAKAKRDPLAKRAYGLSASLGERHSAALNAASRIALFVR